MLFFSRVDKEDKSKEKREEESDDEIEEDFKDFLLQKRGILFQANMYTTIIYEIRH